jgi:hypothetical protein
MPAGRFQWGRPALSEAEVSFVSCLSCHSESASADEESWSAAIPLGTETAPPHFTLQ